MDDTCIADDNGSDFGEMEGEVVEGEVGSTAGKPLDDDGLEFCQMEYDAAMQAQADGKYVEVDI